MRAFFGVVALLTVAAVPVAPNFSADTPVRDLVAALGGPAVPARDAEAVQRGRELVHQGTTTGPDGRRTKRQSKEFLCTDCHVVVAEDPVLGVFDPEARLDRAIAEDLPLLPGTTLYGITDRARWFNGDWQERYGDLVTPARDDLRAATELCWRECSQGREPEDWEIEAVVAYMTDIPLRARDLGPDAPTLEQIQSAVGTEKAAAVREELLAAARFPSPATFASPPKKHGRRGGYDGLEGDPVRGAEVYARSCLHCHRKGGPGHYRLAEKRFKYRELLLNMPRKDHESFYEVTRLGTKPHDGAYMPQYSEERMSSQQIEDLRAYLEDAVKR
jgi:mono/diheme cytochrome c family protein